MDIQNSKFDTGLWSCLTAYQLSGINPQAKRGINSLKRDSCCWCSLHADLLFHKYCVLLV